MKSPNKAIRVGDLIQYFYQWRPTSARALTTKAVTEIIDGGAAFIVEGGYRVQVGEITVHIPMHASGEAATDDRRRTTAEQRS
jgi:hypothetical protein